MPVYHFNLCNADAILDCDGTDLPDAGAARRHAIAVAKELTFHSHATEVDWSRYTMSVIDDAGREILSFAIDAFPKS
jgi:hypothetical protein